MNNVAETTTSTNGSSSDIGHEPIVKSGGNASISDEEFALLEDVAGQKNNSKGGSPAELKGGKNEKEGKENDKEEEVIVKKEDLPEGDQHGKPSDRPVKVYKLKSGNETIDLKDDTIIPVKIDGKTQEVQIRDLVGQYSGKINYSVKYQELAEQRKTIENEKSKLQGGVDQLYKLAVQDNDPRAAIEYLAEQMGADPEQIWSSLVGPMKEQYKKLSGLSEEEISRQEAQEELEYYRKRETRRKEDAAKSRENETLLTRIHSVREKTGLTAEQFKSCYDELCLEAQRSNFDTNQITPEMVGEYFSIVDRKDKIKAATSEIIKDEPEKIDAVSSVLLETWKQNPDFTIDDIKDIASQVYGKPKQRSTLAKKIVSAQKEENKNQERQLLSWDDF